MKHRRAVITGIYGQDGSYLFELLLENGYEVHGIVRDRLTENDRLIKAHLDAKGKRPIVHLCDLSSTEKLSEVIRSVKPDEFYHLAAIHFSSQESDADKLRGDTELFKNNVASTLNILSSLHQYAPQCRIVLAGSCLMYDADQNAFQNEKTPFNTSSMYGLAKITENGLARHFRRLGQHVSMAIFYNHESPRRSEAFVTKKVVKNLVAISKGERESFEIGDIYAKRDWGYARDYVRGVWLIAQQKAPRDYILATGERHSVKDLIVAIAKKLHIEDWRRHVTINRELISRKKKSHMVGDAALAGKKLKWSRSVDFAGLVDLLVKNELSGKLD